MSRFILIAPSCLLLVFMLHESAALKIFSPSSLGTRYFDNSQIGIITTNPESDKPSFSGRKYEQPNFQHSYHYHQQHQHSPHQHSPHHHQHTVEYFSASYDNSLPHSHNSGPSKWPSKVPPKIPINRPPLGGGGINKPSISVFKPVVVTSKPTSFGQIFTTRKPMNVIPFRPPIVQDKIPIVQDKIPITQDKIPNKTGCKCKCGMKHDAFKMDDAVGPQNIIGGQEARLSEFPWVVRLAVRGRTFCGGALINDKYILTAAHCISSRSKEEIQVVIGDHDQTTATEAASVTKAVAAILPHELYDKQNYTNDIALLRLISPINFADNIQPACLPPAGMLDPPGRMGEIAGWGRTAEKGKGSDRILKVAVPLLSQKQCREKKIRPARITATMLCAGEANKDSCQGDSGGPLLVQNSVTGKHEVHGVVSWGIGCGRDGYPGIYTRVSKYMDWIQKKMPDACSCN